MRYERLILASVFWLLCAVMGASGCTFSPHWHPGERHYHYASEKPEQEKENSALDAIERAFKGADNVESSEKHKDS